MLPILSRNRFLCFCIAAMVLINFISDLHKIMESAAFAPTAEQVKAFVAMAGGSATQQLAPSWNEVVSLQQFLHYRIERFGMIGDVVLLACAAIILCLLGAIGIIYHRASDMTSSIHRLFKAVMGMYWIAIGVCLGMSAAYQIGLFRLDASGILGVNISWSLESDLRTIFGQPWSTHGQLGMMLIFALPLLIQLGKSIQEEESTV